MKVCQNQENEHIKTKEINMTNTGHEIITQGTMTPNYMEYEKMLATEKELREERDAVADLLG